MAGGPEYRPFNPDGPLRFYWRQPKATYFVTFRQADSIPEIVLAEWLDKRAGWLRAHGIDPDWAHDRPDRFASAYCSIPWSFRRAYERANARWLHRELDRCQGSCVLRHHEPQEIVRKSLMHFHGQRLWLGDSVIMPNHVHTIVQPWDGWELEELLGSVKKWTSRHISMWLAEQAVTSAAAVSADGSDAGRPRQPRRARFWQQESYDRIIRDQHELAIFRRYIAANPQHARLRPVEFFYHRAAWLDAFART